MKNKRFDLSGKVALITGATGDIGQGIARYLHQAGADVIITGRRAHVLDLLKNNLSNRCVAEVCVLEDMNEIDLLVQKIGPVDILINNAGITRDSLFLRMKMDSWDQVMNINLKAPVFLTKKILPYMIKNRWGRVINISSVIGVTGNVGQTNYAASKAAIIAFSKSLAREVASRGVTVNCVAPGFIKTDMTARLPDTTKNLLLKNIPLGRQGLPEEVAALVLFLASEESQYITGETIHVNGGLFMSS